MSVGKRADIAILDGSGLPLDFEQLIGAIVTVCDPSDVDSVLVDGRFVKRHGRLLHDDLRGLRRGAAVLMAVGYFPEDGAARWVTMVVAPAGRGKTVSVCDGRRGQVGSKLCAIAGAVATARDGWRSAVTGSCVCACNFKMEDASLLWATATGDADAFAVFYRRHLPLVVGFAARMTHDREAAADLAGEVFAAALAGCGRYRPTHESAAPWLIGIAQNKLRESQRRGRVQDAVRARIVDQRDYAELAERLRCSESVVRQRVSRGLRRIRAQVSDPAEESER